MNKFLVFLFAILFSNAFASEPQIWTVNTRAEILKGDARSVSVDANGSITPAPKLTELFKTDQQYIWSSAFDSAGNIYLGTGGEGRIYKVSASGSGALFTDLNELNVTAIVAKKDGGLFAATSPDGKVYQIDAAGKATPYFEPKEKYIWSLAVMSDGSLAVGTGDGGKLYRVRSANASPESSVMFDSSEMHIISLATDSKGNLFAGTDSGGLVLKFGADGKPFALLDSPLREIHELAVGPDGSVYALALGESASAAKPPETTASPTTANALCCSRTPARSRRSFPSDRTCTQPRVIRGNCFASVATDRPKAFTNRRCSMQNRQPRGEIFGGVRPATSASKPAAATRKRRAKHGALGMRSLQLRSAARPQVRVRDISNGEPF